MRCLGSQGCNMCGKTAQTPRAFINSLRDAERSARPAPPLAPSRLRAESARFEKMYPSLSQSVQLPRTERFSFDGPPLSTHFLVPSYYLTREMASQVDSCSDPPANGIGLSGSALQRRPTWRGIRQPHRRPHRASSKVSEPPPSFSFSPPSVTSEMTSLPH